jgi:hypothetical protein
MTDSTTFAYLAGVIDSDGYITIQRQARRGRVYFTAKVGISGTRRQPHDLAASIWGGAVSPMTSANPRHRQGFQWTRSGRTAVPVLRDIAPYLLVKRQQAVGAMRLEELLEAGRGDDPYPWSTPEYDPTPEREELWINVVDLNQARNKIRQPLPA